MKHARRRRRNPVVVASITFLGILVSLVVGWAFWAGYSAGQQREVAERVATSLAALRIDDAAFEDGTAAGARASLAGLTADLNGYKPQVNVQGVFTWLDLTSAQATLRYEWKIQDGQQPWTYDAHLALRLTTSGWKATWTPSALAPGLSDGQRLQVARTPAERSEIFGANGEPIVRNVPGVGDKRSVPMPVTPHLMSQIVGEVGLATPEYRAQHPETLDGDLVGLTGLQASQNKRLQGTPGYQVKVVDASGAQASQLANFPPITGTPLVTTIDVSMQKAAESVLASVGPASALVAIRPSDGHVLAVASGPGSKNFSTATQGVYEPASSFKIVSGLALVRQGWTADKPMDCTPAVKIGDKWINNGAGYHKEGSGVVPWKLAFAHSCNTGPINAGAKVSQAEIVSAGESLGLLSKPDLGIPVEMGTIPATVTSELDHAYSMIGVSPISATPFGMTVVSASVAKGEVVRPVLIPELAKEVTPPSQPLTHLEAHQLRLLMRETVVSGSGKKTLENQPGQAVYAKTGTYIFFKPDGRYSYHTWMVTFQGDLAVTVFVEEGEGGGPTCGPLLSQFLAKVQPS